jgi:hypothetical protein
LKAIKTVLRISCADGEECAIFAGILLLKVDPDIDEINGLYLSFDGICVLVFRENNGKSLSCIQGGDKRNLL